MFRNNEDLRNELEIKKADNEKLKSQVELLNIKLEQLQKQYEHKHNELVDIVSSVFLSFRKIVEIAERNDYGQPEQKTRQIREFAEKQKNHYAQLTINTPISIKNRTTTTDQSNK